MLRACSFFTNKQHCKHSAEASRTPQSLRDSSSFSQRGAPKIILCCYNVECRRFKHSAPLSPKEEHLRLLFVAIMLNVGDLSTALLFPPKRSTWLLFAYGV